MIKVFNYRFIVCVGLLFAIPAFAQTPKVSVSLAPLHSLVAQLGEGVFEPALIYSVDQSPHSAALKPSQLSNVINADLLIWVDETLEQSLGRIIAQRKPSGLVMQLYEEDDSISYEHDLMLLNNRPSLFELDADGHDSHQHTDGHGHDVHDHGQIDPHFWLNPNNALQFSRAVYQQLVLLDASNAEHYLENLTKLEAELQQLQLDIEAVTRPVQDAPFIVFHDGFQYFEHAFSLKGIGAVVLIPDQPPGPKTISSLIEAAQEHNVVCLFAEPQYDRKYLTFIQAKLSSAKVDVIDTLGSELVIGDTLYKELLTQLAAKMVNCLESSK